MRGQSQRLIGLLLVSSLVCMAVAKADPVGIDGMLGLQTNDGSGWMAIRVDFDETLALSGVTWYNNDGSTEFPAVLIGAGLAAGPGDVDSFFPVAASVAGQSDEWSECVFSEPVGASLGGLYVVFEFPAGPGYTMRGLGGGPAIGFSEGLTEPQGWISGDGENWHPLAGDFGFAINPVLIAFTEGMQVKSLGDGVDPLPSIPSEYYATVGPNPFNPQVTLRFGLPISAYTTAEIFDIRGRRIKRLLDQEMSAGHHELTWKGQDQSGRQVSSGVYFVRIASGEMDNITRVMMVK